MGRPTYIEPVKPGGRTTLLSASKANELIHALNLLLNMRGSNGITVNVTEGNITIGLSLDKPQGDDPNKGGSTGGGGTGITIQGEWATGQTYAIGDVVYRTSSTAIQADAAGTYYCIQAHTSAAGNAPPTGTTNSNSYWQTLARGHWDEFQIYDSGDPSSGKLYCIGGKLELYPDNSSTAIDMGTIPAGMAGKTAEWKEITVCDSGVTKTMYVLGTTPAT